MKKYAMLFITVIFSLSVLTSCRPPELEGAFVDYNAGRFDSAFENAKIATEKYSDNAEAWYLLGVLYSKEEMYKEMVQAFDKSLNLAQTFKDKITNERNAAFSTAFNSGVNNYNAYTKIEDRQSEKALETINKSIKGFKDANIIKTDYKAISLVASGFNMSDRPDSALVYYTELTKINPDTADAWISLGNYYFYKKDYQSTLENMKKAMEIEPDNVEAITAISQSYDMLEETENAINAYEKARELNPDEKAFPYNLGLIYNKMLNKEGISDEQKSVYYEKLIDNFGSVIEIDPEIEIPYQIKAYAEIGLKNYEEAIETLNEGLEYFPEAGQLWFNLGVAYTHLNNEAEAKDAFAKAEELGY